MQIENPPSNDVPEAEPRATVTAPVALEVAPGAASLTGPIPLPDPTPAPPQPAGWRVPLVWHAADRMPLTLGDQTLYPYEGQGVWLLPMIPTDLKLVNAELLTVARRMQRAQKAEDEAAATAGIERTAELIARLRSLLARVVAGWTLTDMRGDAMPSPYGNPDAFDAMDEEAFTWLMRRVMGVDDADEGAAEDPEGN